MSTKPSRLKELFTKWPHCLATYFAIGLAVAMLVFCTGCASRSGIRHGETQVNAPKDAGTPATLDASTADTVMPIPGQSVVRITETEAQPAVPATPDSPAVEAQPATVVTEIIPSAPTVITRKETATKAGTGTVDTSVAKHRIDVAERRWLLWAALVCGIGGLIVRSMLPAWPALSNGLLLGGALAFASWKLAEVPTWIWAAVLGAVAFLVLGYKRAEWDRDGDGVPDFLQRNGPKPPTGPQP